MARAKKKPSAVKVNFKGVESRKTPPEGDYKMEVIEAKMGESSAGNDQIEIVAEITSGEYKGFKGYLYCGLADNVLWKLHAFLTVLGEEVPDEEMEIDLPDLIGKEFVGVLTHETYNGKKRAKLTDFDSIENYSGKDEDGEDDEDEDDKKSKGKKSKKDDDTKGKKPKGKSKSDDDEDDDEDDKPAKKSKKSKSDDDEDEDEKPKSKKGDKGKKKPKKYDRDDVEDMDEEELQEVIDDSGIDVDLDDYKKLKKKVEAVIDALEEEDLLDE